MPICEACGEEVAAVYRCRECDGLFCDECGDPKLGICVYCAEEDIGEGTGIA